MNKDFARTITFLRKEKKLSQKQAASELGISQALLSHYEKGIRECGLDFVVKAADYYNVSCDYLLGRTADRDYDLKELTHEKESKKQSATQVINRRLISSMLNVIYDFSATAKNRKLDRTITYYIMVNLYRLFRRLYSANSKNPQELFTVPEGFYAGYSSAAVAKCYTDISCMADKNSSFYLESLGKMEESPEQLAEEYPESAGEIFNVIQQAESIISKLKM